MIMGSKGVTVGSHAGAEEGYSVDALTKLFGVNRRTLLARLKAATPVKSGPGGGKLYRLADVAQGFVSRPLRGREAEEEAGLRTRKLAAETGLAELKLKRERGEVVAVADVRADYHEAFREFHTRFTVTVPQRLGPRLRVAQTAREAEEMLRVELEREFYEYRTEEAQYLDNWDEAEGLKEEETDDEEA
jgi:hypothetical protein